MKKKANEVAAFVNNPDPAMRAILIYGSDAGAVREHSKSISKWALGDNHDPLLMVRLNEDELAQDPAKLNDEASAIAMFGGNKVIEVRVTNDRHVDIFADYLLNPSPDSLVLIEAGSLKPSSKLRKLIEGTACAVALPCFEDGAQDVQQVARQFLEKQGFRIEQQALAYLSRHLGADRGITMSELERLSLYMGPPKEREPKMITLDDVEALIHDNAATSVYQLVDAVALGQLDDMDRDLIRLETAGETTQRLLIVLRGHFQSLHQTLSVLQNNRDTSAALRASFRPPLHFKREAKVKQQLKLWSLGKVEAALTILHKAERQCRTTNAPIQAIGQNTFLRLARAAAR